MNPFLWVLTVLGGLIGIVLLLMLHLVFGRLRLVVDYKSGELKLWLEWLFLKYIVYPDPEKKAEREARQNERKAQKQSTGAPSHTDPKQNSTASSAREKPRRKSKLRAAAKKEVRKAVQSVPLKDYAKTLQIIATKFIAKFHCKSFVLHASIGGGEADTVATDYGTVNALLYPVLGAFSAAGRLHKCNVQITPDFTSEQTHAEGRAVFTFRLFQALGCIWELSENLYD